MAINLIIDGQSVTAQDDFTLLEAARSVGIDIPTICFHEATTANALCRICVVEVSGQRLLQPACVIKVVEGMQVQTKSDRVIKARRTILELLISSVDVSEAPEILDMAREYQAANDRFPAGEKREQPLIDDNPMYVRDYSKCILCWRCVQVCADDAQYLNALSFGKRGFHTHIATFMNEPMPATSCVFCGQCIGVCPSGAIKPKSEHLLQAGLSSEEISSRLLEDNGGKFARRRPGKVQKAGE